MNKPLTLHWSYAYDGGNQAPLFGRQLERLLAQALVSGDQDDTAQQSYAILPNFWSGYKSEAEIEIDGGIAVGELRIDRVQQADRRWRYAVCRTHSTSGETAHYRFWTRNDRLRTIDGAWSMRSDQSGSGAFGGLEAEGAIDGDHVALTMSGRTLEIGRLDPGQGVVPFWAISDWAFSGATPVAASGDFDQVAVMENMSRLRNGVSVQQLEPWRQRLPTGGFDIDLQGFMLCGQGLPPVYWWFAEDGRLLIVSTIFETYVRARAGKVEAERAATW